MMKKNKLTIYLTVVIILFVCVLYVSLKDDYKDILNALQADAEVWANFQSFPPLYQRVRIDTIQIKKKQPELFQSRLQKLLDNTKAGVMYGEWNDNGRLLIE